MATFSPAQPRRAMTRLTPACVLNTHCMKPGNGYPSEPATYVSPVAFGRATGPRYDSALRFTGYPALRVLLSVHFEHPAGDS
jgi:hypothetical protein